MTQCNLSYCTFGYQALSKTLTEDELYYLHRQFSLLEPNRGGRISFENFRQVSGY